MNRALFPLWYSKREEIGNTRRLRTLFASISNSSKYDFHAFYILQQSLSVLLFLFITLIVSECRIQQFTVNLEATFLVTGSLLGRDDVTWNKNFGRVQAQRALFHSGFCCHDKNTTVLLKQLSFTMIVYALVSVGKNVLAEYTATFGTFVCLR